MSDYKIVNAATIIILSASALFAHDGADDHIHLSPAINVRTWTITESEATLEGALA